MFGPVPWSPPHQPFRGSDVQAFGITARKLAGEVRRGTLVRLRRGVYLPAADVPEDPRELHLVLALAEQVVNPRLIASHDTAALAWQLPLPEEARSAAGPVMFLAPRGETRRSASGERARVRVGHLAGCHVTTDPHGLRLTTRSRTAVDIAAALPLPEALMLLDAALRAECLAMPFVSRRQDLANPRVRAAGLAPMLEAAATHDSDALRVCLRLTDPRHETPIESLSRGYMHLAGLPVPVPQHEVMTSAGRCYPDFLWPEHGVAGEADGRIKYHTADDMMREKTREQALRDTGLVVVRWTGREIRLTPGRVMDRISRALAHTSTPG